MKEKIKEALEELYNKEVGFGKGNYFREELDEIIDILQTIREYPGLIKYVQEYKNYNCYFQDDSIIPYIDGETFDKVKEWWDGRKVEY